MHAAARIEKHADGHWRVFFGEIRDRLLDPVLENPEVLLPKICYGSAELRCDMDGNQNQRNIDAQVRMRISRIVCNRFRPDARSDGNNRTILCCRSAPRAVLRQQNQ
jgi:hypothetical protein